MIGWDWLVVGSWMTHSINKWLREGLRLTESETDSDWQSLVSHWRDSVTDCDSVSESLTVTVTEWVWLRVESNY